jgi:hypothetical protein
MDNVISGLWVKGPLNELGLLTVRSFVAQGYTFHLYSYELTAVSPEPGMIILDADLILNKSALFSYEKKNAFGHGKGSFAGFSDIFRYKLLFEKGGWWSDMDITCLQPLPHDKPYYFRAHHELPLVGNLLKAPKGSELMRQCFERAFAEVKADNTDWHLPIQILIDEVEALKLTNYIVNNSSNDDHWDRLKPFIFSNRPRPLNWSIIHWQNEVWRHQEVKLNTIARDSVLAKLLIEYDVLKADVFKKETFSMFPFVFVLYVLLGLLIGEHHPFSRFPMYDNLPNWSHSFEVQDTSGNLIPCTSLHIKGGNLNHWYGHFCEQQQIDYGYWYETSAEEEIIGRLIANRVKQINPDLESFQIIKKHYFHIGNDIHCDTVLLYSTKKLMK